MWSYLLESSVWSIGGLLVGYTLGRTERGVRELNRKVGRLNRRIGRQERDDDNF